MIRENYITIFLLSLGYLLACLADRDVFSHLYINKTHSQHNNNFLVC